MYRKKYYNCNCDVKCEQPNVLGTAEESLCRIEEGRKDILCGLHLICCCCKICEGMKRIERGICRMEKGLEGFVGGLQGLEFECDYRNNNNIKEGVCGIKEALHCLKKGLCQLQNCCLCDGIETVQCGLQILDGGLCHLTKGLEEVRGDLDSGRRCRCC